MRVQRNTRGFTLVEIMIVVAIIGLLAAIAVPNFVQARNTARTNTCKNNLRIIDAAKEQFAMDNNKSNGYAVTSTEIAPYLKGSAMPTEPSSGTYTVSNIGTNPTCSVGGTHTL